MRRVFHSVETVVEVFVGDLESPWGVASDILLHDLVDFLSARLL